MKDITVALTDSEYNTLLRTMHEQGKRSIAAFVRNAVLVQLPVHPKPAPVMERIQESA